MEYAPKSKYGWQKASGSRQKTGHDTSEILPRAAHHAHRSAHQNDASEATQADRQQVATPAHLARSDKISTHNNNNNNRAPAV
jgi:hypothetical protein